MKKMLLEIITAALVLVMAAASLAGCMHPNAPGAIISRENPAVEATAGAAKTEDEEAVASGQDGVNDGGMSGNGVECRLKTAMKEFLIGLVAAFVFTVAVLALIDYMQAK